ncbi:dihydrolipoyl dehydrogenase family protein [Secundilactobacillus silagei]|uniref:Glutathione reductase n=1 Tax=Secundilactobacillus silagei JCM 19001 TaxID=1302250 RepID=A0A1Z5IG70_9LACO|nr:NAD(P)/FAD-dependent oxidoreductase [Secundilactobacillus silagei]TDG73298.1 hypothetical protein C5L25_000447 [Secundilactobacillus silagei JCM 19001]GAX00669.1 glutathione reductase [Secundilactobacillus silagei JCM 19001]
MKNYDNIIIGSGPAAYKFTAHATGSTLVIEGSTFGGICPNYGCEPKIFLDGSARAVLLSRKLIGKGIQQPATIDWPTLMARKLAVFGQYPRNSVKLFQSKGADVLQGTAKFVEPHVLDVNGTQYYGRSIIIATGQQPHKLPIKGSEYTLSSNDVFVMQELPERITMIGGGFVSMELASILTAAGVQVDVLEAAKRPLGAFNPAHVEQIVREMSAQGVQFHFNERVAAVNKMPTGFEVVTENGLRVPANQVVDASGRVPNVERLDLQKVGITYSSHGISVNGHLETNVPGVYAAGDVIDKRVPKLTSTAQFEGEYLGRYLASRTQAEIIYPTIAQAAFTFSTNCAGGSEH